MQREHQFGGGGGGDVGLSNLKMEGITNNPRSSFLTNSGTSKCGHNDWMVRNDHQLTIWNITELSMNRATVKLILAKDQQEESLCQNGTKKVSSKQNIRE